MIARRFRALGWVAGIASAATCLYLTSLQVAAERAKLEGVEAQIAFAKRDMRQLQTELGTRASLRQLEKWNGEVLALSAPRAEQYLHGESELASVGVRELRGPTGAAPLAQVMLAAAQPTQVPAPSAAQLAPVIAASAAPRVATPTIQRVAFVRTEPRAKPAKTAALEKTKATKPKRDAKPSVRVTIAKAKPKAEAKLQPKRLAKAEPVKHVKSSDDTPRKEHKVLTPRALGDLARVAANEGRHR